MIRTRRYVLLSTLTVFSLTLLAPVSDSGVAQARSRRGSSVHAKSGSKKSSRARSSRRHHARRHFTARGNPEITRTVAVALLAEKLPSLASLVGVQADPTVTPDAAVAQPQTLVALTGISSSSFAGAYHDSEYDETEDPDGLTAEDEADLEDLPDEINDFYREFTSYMATLNGEPMMTVNGLDKQVVMESVMSWLGTRYLFGGMSRSGIDCSAFTGTVYRAMNFHLPRTAAAQYDAGIPVNADDMQFGDLVFFHTRASVYVSHVGMYLGQGLFVHASSRNGVTVSSLSSDYYSTHLIGARRFNLTSVAAVNDGGKTQLN